MDINSVNVNKYLSIRITLLVGYGDMFILTLLGKIIGSIAILYGICTISLIIVAFTEFLDLAPIEKEAYELIRKMNKDSDSIQHSETLWKAIGRICLWKLRMRIKYKYTAEQKAMVILI